MNMTRAGNKLTGETSPYLLQHAYNPVQWYPWGDEALQKAIVENKPILVSIGYSACHWCHVMEKESFEDESTATIMNEHFVNIKIDREERPDLDHIYMDAVQAMTGSGGWPLNVFLTPDRKPFYGGTYFPPVNAYNRLSWKEVLENVAKAFKERRHEIDAQAFNLTEHLASSNSFGTQQAEQNETVFTKEKLDLLTSNILKAADKECGGFGRAPKFPQTQTIQFLLRHNNISGNEEVLKQALLSLDKMCNGGIYDQIGGGFARYATDTTWLVPHFEKMLYDNALLIAVLSEAYQLTGQQRYKEVIDETMLFIQREMLHSQNGFYAALDADSEGVEGKFYVWKKEEIEEVLRDDAILFCDYYGVTQKGNWEHVNILHVKQNSLNEEEANLIKKCKERLLHVRNKRIKPQLDDKVILGWNALMNTAACKAFAATGNETYRQLAIANMNFILHAFARPDDASFSHTWKNGQAKYPAFLDDYAFLIEALIHLQEITGDAGWLIRAKELTELVLQHFQEKTSGFFFYTSETQTDVIVRKKDVYDGAVPSGNSVMAYNLWRLGILLDMPVWKEQSVKMLTSLNSAITRYPTSFGNWANLLLEISAGTDEIVIGGQAAASVLDQLLRMYIPNRVLMITGSGYEFPLLSGKPVIGETMIYYCQNYSCKQPVKSANDLMVLISSGKRKQLILD